MATRAAVGSWEATSGLVPRCQLATARVAHARRGERQRWRRWQRGGGLADVAAAGAAPSRLARGEHAPTGSARADAAASPRRTDAMRGTGAGMCLGCVQVPLYLLFYCTGTVLGCASLGTAQVPRCPRSASPCRVENRLAGLCSLGCERKNNQDHSRCARRCSGSSSYRRW